MMKVLFLMLMTTVVTGFPSFQQLIPNGARVPNPCSSSGGVWPGVGHFNVAGGGSHNPFGDDFALAGHVWGSVLCQKDSDGDGKTNGEELGDPTCLFTPNTNAPVTAPTGHPGICEPIGSAACSSQTFTCPVFV